jgi:hypothetical protein
MAQQRRGFSTNNIWVGVITLVLGIVAIYFLFIGLYKLLYLLSPVLIVLALIIDYKVVTGYLMTIWNLLKTNTIVGIGASLLTFFGYPFVSGYLFAKALFKRQLKKFEETHGTQARPKQEEFTEYEVVEDEPHLELPELSKEELPNEYDDIFGNEGS